jgi:predicted phage terminase large subunit-like protein
MEKDPAYLGNLLALNRVDRLRLKEGNWNVRAQAGMLFQREWFPVIDAIPSGWLQVVRMWDRAATKPHEGNKDPDWTRGLKMYKYADGTFVVGDLCSIRDTPGQVERLIKTVAGNDTVQVKIVAHQDPGSAGVLEAENFTKLLVGYYVKTYVVPRDVSTGKRDKITRAKPVSAQCEGGNIKVLRAGWNDDFFAELENFPDGVHDDIVDAFSGAFNDLSGGLSLADVL